MPEATKDPVNDATQTADEALADRARHDPELKRVNSAIRRLVLEYDRFEDASKLLKRALTTYGDAPEGDCYLLFGPPGVGKSTTIDAFVDDFGNRRREDGNLKRDVLRVNVPSRPHPGAIYRAFLTALEAPDDGSKVHEMAGLIKTQAQRQGVRLVILDEVNHMVEDKKEKFVTTASRDLKAFLSENCFNVVLAGTEDTFRVYEHYAQIQRRGGFEYEMLAFDWESEEDRIHFLDLLGMVNDELPLPTYVELRDFDLARKLHHASRGLPNGLMKLLAAASMEAVEAGDGTVREGHLWAGFQSLRRMLTPTGTDLANPFKQPPNARRKVGVRFRPPVEDEPTGLSSRKASRAGGTFRK